MTILAVASGGGHWIELLRLRPAFGDQAVHYVTVQDKYRDDVAGSPFHVVRDATRWQRWAVAGLQCITIELYGDGQNPNLTGPFQIAR